MSSSKGKANSFTYPPDAKPQDRSGTRTPEREPDGGNTPHKTSATESDSSGRATYYGTVIAANYNDARSNLVDEYVSIWIDDSICPYRLVDSRGMAARKLREAVGGMWQKKMPVKVTLRGVTNVIEHVERILEVVGDEGLTPADLE